MSLQKRPRIEMPKLRKAANGADCLMHLSGICNHDTETTVLAHRDRAGMGMKGDDFNAMNMCSCCHDVYDQRTPSEFTRQHLTALFDEVWPEQVEWWIRNGHLS